MTKQSWPQSLLKRKRQTNFTTRPRLESEADGAVTVRAVQKATSTIPIVFSVVVEPIGDKLTTNLQRPDGNTTGVTTFDPHQAVKELEFLKMLRQTLTRVAILSDLDVSECLSNSNREAAQKLGLQPQNIRVKGPFPDYQAAFSAMDQGRAEALVVLEGICSSSSHARRVCHSGHRARCSDFYLSRSGTLGASRLLLADQS